MPKIKVTIEDDMAHALSYLAEVDGVSTNQVLCDALRREVERRDALHRAALRDSLTSLIDTKTMPETGR